MVLDLVIVQFLRVDSIFIVDTSVEFSNSDELGSFLNEELRCPVAHITEALNDESLAFDSRLNSKVFCNLLIAQHLFRAIVDS